MTELKTHPPTVPGAVLDPLHVEKPSALYRTSFDPLHVEKPSALYRTSFDPRSGDGLGASRPSHEMLSRADYLWTQAQPPTTAPLDEQLRLP